jgi:NDP-sugar pyrophosphorylase family protein
VTTRSDVCGIVLAGVHSWDDSAFDELLPRPLMPVVHTPLICHILAWLRSAGITHATVCANSASRPMRCMLTDGTALGLELGYYEDWTPRGPAGCIRDASSQAGAPQVVVVDGTILPQCDLHAMLKAHARSGAAMTIVMAHDPDSAKGGLERFVPVGIYMLDRTVLQHIPETGYQDIKEVLLPRLHAGGIGVRTHLLPTACPRLTDAASYLALNARALERLMHSEPPPGYRRIGQNIVHESVHPAPLDCPSDAALTDAGAAHGPALVGPDTTLATSATLIGPVVIGAGCVIEPGAVVCRSILWDNCRVGRGAAISDCVLGEAVQVQAEKIVSHAVLTAEPPECSAVRRGPCANSFLFPLPLEGGRQHLSSEELDERAAERSPRSSGSVSGRVAST